MAAGSVSQLTHIAIYLLFTTIITSREVMWRDYTKTTSTSTVFWQTPIKLLDPPTSACLSNISNLWELKSNRKPILIKLLTVKLQAAMLKLKSGMDLT